MQLKSTWLYGFVALVFAFWLIFAWVGWFERLNSDAGYYFFHAINSKTFYVEHGRYVLALAEIPALFFVWLGGTLKSAAIAYSIGHVLFFIICAVATWFLCRSPVYPIVLALCATMGLRESVYTPQFELYYGLATLVVVHALYVSGKWKKNAFVLGILCLLILLVFTSHPMAVLCFLSLFVLQQVFDKKWEWRSWIAFLLLFGLYVIWKKLSVSGYEDGKIGQYLNAIQSGKIQDIFFKGIIWKQSWFLCKYYPDVLLLAAFVGFEMIRNKRGFVVLFYGLTMLGFLCLVWMLYPDTITIFRYLEQVMFPFVFVAILGLLFVPMRHIKWIFIFVGIFIFRSIVIVRANEPFTKRTALMDAFISLAAQKDGQRFFVTPKDMGQEQYDLGDWSYGFETLMRAQTTKGKTITITKEEDLFFQGNDTLLKPDEYLFRMWEREKTNTLNSDYFQFVSGKYEALLPIK